MGNSSAFHSLQITLDPLDAQDEVVENRETDIAMLQNENRDLSERLAEKDVEIYKLQGNLDSNDKKKWIFVYLVY